MAFNPLEREGDAFRVVLYVIAVFLVVLVVTLAIQAL